MTQDDGGYELRPLPEGEKPALAPSDSAGALPPGDLPKPGEPGWVPPVPIIEKLEQTEVTPAEIADAKDVADIQQHKVAAALGYILFVIPLIAAPNSKFARYHANQGLLLLILLFVVVMLVSLLTGGVWAIDHFLRGRIDLLATFFNCGFYLLQVAMLVGWAALAVMGIVHAMSGVREPLPVIGHWTLIEQHHASIAVSAQVSANEIPISSQEEKKP